MGRIVIVSNRVSSFKRDDPDTGGMAVGIREMLAKTGGIWFGWSGKLQKDDSNNELHLEQHGNITLITLDLLQADIDNYYLGYANQVIWPLFHCRPDCMEYSQIFEQSYHAVNEKFALRLIELLQPEDNIWVHDYPLLPLASALRRLGCRHKIGFFLHIPFPSVELLTRLPRHRELFATLGSYDLIGFQTFASRTNFCHYVEEENMGVFSPAEEKISLGERNILVKVFPIGIDPASFSIMAAKSLDFKPIREFRQRIGERKLIIGVDRLDYSKGLIRRAKAHEYLLKHYPDLHRTYQILQVTPLTRSKVPVYTQTRKELKNNIMELNGKFSDLDWTPIRYSERSYSRRTLSALYRLAAVGLVTPLSDGMNLVAKEYIAAQNPANPGVLILSHFAGAAQQLTQALLVNPYDSEEVGEAIYIALDMPLAKRKENYYAMIETLHKYTIYDWCNAFIKCLKAGQGS